MPFEKTIDKNDKITNDLKQMTKECFLSIYETLGKNNFRRWLHTREISKEVKELIIDWMSEEDKEMQPGAAGFAFSKGHIPEIRIKNPQILELKRTQVHELYHFITRHADRFCIYLNEGITEYMAQETLKSENVKYIAYEENVEMVRFLHSMLGDSLIKGYLLGKDEKFDEKFATLISEDKNDITKAREVVNEFYDILNRRHKLLYTISKEDIEEAKGHKEERKVEFEENTANTKEMIRKIILGKIRQEAKNLKFYEAGKITNLSLINEWINKMPSGVNFTFEEKFNLEQEALGIVFENSHLLVDLEGKEKEQKKEKLIESVISAKKDKNGEIAQVTRRYLNTDEINQEDSEITSKLFEKTFEDEENIQLIDFVYKTINILNHVKTSERESNALISQYAIKMLGEKADIPFVDNLIKQNIDKYQNLFDIEQQRKRDTIESHYRKIDDNSYIEKRDNQYFYINIDSEGKITEEELKNSLVNFQDNIKIDRIESNEKRVVEIQKEEGQEKRKVYVITKGSKSITVSINENLESVRIHGSEDKYKELGIIDSKEFIELEMIAPILQQIRSKENKSKYMSILDDEQNPYKIKGVQYTADVDLRSRKLNLETLSSDIQKIKQVLTKEETAKMLQESLIEETLDYTFGTTKKEQKDGEYARTEEEQNAYDIIKNGIISNELKNDDINDAIKTLNNSRKERIEQNRKSCLVGFKTPEAKKEYHRQQRIEEIRETTKIKFELENELGHPERIPINRYYIIEGEISEELKPKREEIAYGLKGINIVGPSIDDRSRKLLVDRLCEDLSRKTQGLPNREYKKEILEEYVNTVLRKIYGNKLPEEEKDKEEKLQQLQESYDYISKSIAEKIMNKKEIDEGLMSKNISVLDENRKQNIRNDNKKIGRLIGFQDETTQMIYEQLVNLSKQLPKSQFDMVAQGLVNAANKQYNKGEKDGASK